MKKLIYFVVIGLFIGAAVVIGIVSDNEAAATHPAPHPAGVWVMQVVPSEPTAAWRLNTATGFMERCQAVSTPVCISIP